MKTKAVLAGIVCLMAGFVIAQSTQPEMPKGVKDAKERCDKEIDRAEQAYIKAKSKALSAYYAQLDRAVKSEKDPEIAKQLSDERAKIREEITELNSDKIPTSKGLIGLRLTNRSGSIFCMKADGTFWIKRKGKADFIKDGSWETIDRCLLIKFNNGNQTPVIESKGKIYQSWDNQLEPLIVSK